jgi:hypothetical protein
MIANKCDKCALSSKTIVQIRKRPVLADYKLRPVEVPEPEHASLTLDGPANQAMAGASQMSLASVPSLTHSGSTMSALGGSQTYMNIDSSGFPISALSMTPKQQTSTNQSIWAPRTNQRRSPSVTSSAFSNFLDDRVDDDDMDHDVSEMDWTPTGPAYSTLTPNRPMLERIPESNQKSPTAGLFTSGLSLPPAPMHPAHRAVKPSGRIGAFEERGLRAKGGLLAEESESEAERPGSQTGLFTKKKGKTGFTGLNSRLASRNEIPMAAPKFQFSQGGASQEVETGLEGLFNSVFSLSDVPKEVIEGQQSSHRAETRALNGRVREDQGSSKGWIGKAVWMTVAFAVLAGALGAGYAVLSGNGLETWTKDSQSPFVQGWRQTPPERTPRVEFDSMPQEELDT